MENRKPVADVVIVVDGARGTCTAAVVNFLRANGYTAVGGGVPSEAVALNDVTLMGISAKKGEHYLILDANADMCMDGLVSNLEIQLTELPTREEVEFELEAFRKVSKALPEEDCKLLDTAMGLEPLNRLLISHAFAARLRHKVRHRPRVF